MSTESGGSPVGRPNREPPLSQEGGPAVPPPAMTPKPGELWLPERPATMDETGRRQWVYPAASPGRFMRARTLVSYVLIAVLFVLPWVRINGMPAILLQIPERRFVLFGHLFWPQDGFYLVFVLLALALCLFFFTALAGRVWCGWACPQTVFLEGVFRRIEEWIEGDHHARRRRDEGPWTLDKAGRKALKHAIFLLLAALVSNTFLAYFVGMDKLLYWMLGSPLDHWTAFLFMAVALGLFYFDFAWFREQFCTVVCPYARFQAVLTDQHTVQVGYDTRRGEPRGHLGKAAGDCIDCHRCVVVCPTGIDIRQGFQLECIGCARCIDACDEIMVRIGKPKGLIRYDSLSRLRGEMTRIFRPRVAIYSVLLVGVIAALIVLVGVRPSVDLTVVRPPGNPFDVEPGDLVSNRFSVRLINRGQNDRTLRLAVSGPPGVHIDTVALPVTMHASEQVKVDLIAILPKAQIHFGRVPIKVQAFDGDAAAAEQAAVFLGPFSQ